MPISEIPARSTRTAAEVGGCICCGATKTGPRFRILTQCQECGYIWADTRLSPADIQRLYREDYFRGEEYGDYLADEKTHRRNFAYRFRELRRIAPDVRSVFEIGCAYGFWLDECSRNGIQASGVDVCPEAVQHASETLKQKATLGDFLELSLEPGRYDAFCMWDTIEHLANPERFVAKAHDLLAPGGWLFLTTGDIGSRMARFRGPRWRLIHPPTHLHYFARKTMDSFLKRHGFEVVLGRSTPFYRNIGEVLGRLSASGKGLTRHTAALCKRILPGFVQRGGFWLDLGDIMFVAARKTGK